MGMRSRYKEPSLGGRAYGAVRPLPGSGARVTTLFDETDGTITLTVTVLAVSKETPRCSGGDRFVVSPVAASLLGVGKASSSVRLCASLERAFTVRETKQGADIQLPQKNYKTVAVEMEARQAELYSQYKHEFASILLQSGQPILDETEDSLKLPIRLVQVASNPRLIDDSYRGTPAKLLVLRNLVDEIIDRGKKVIVWTSFTAKMSIGSRENSEHMGPFVSTGSLVTNNGRLPFRLSRRTWTVRF
jgi:hypothetical protein